MTKNNKGRNRWHGATPKTADNPNYIKPSRIKRKQKRGWQRGARR